MREYVGEYPSEYELSPGDILLVMTCQTSGGEILCVPGRIPDDGKIYLHNQRLRKVVVKNPDEIDLDYLYALFRWRNFNHHLYATATGTKILHTAPSRIESFKFLLPPLERQIEIGQTLRALDDKIELNRKMNRTLEAMARAIFKSWFIDFDPVRAKMEGRQPSGLDPETAALFPDRRTDSELGPIPPHFRSPTFPKGLPGSHNTVFDPFRRTSAFIFHSRSPLSLDPNVHFSRSSTLSAERGIRKKADAHPQGRTSAFIADGHRPFPP